MFFGGYRMSAEQRQMAATETSMFMIASLVRTYYEALLAHGFTADQALYLTDSMQESMVRIIGGGES